MKNNIIIFLLLMLNIVIYPQYNFGEKFNEGFKEGMRRGDEERRREDEERRFQEEMRYRREEQKRYEEREISGIRREINEIQENTINIISSYNNRRSSLIEKEIENIRNSYIEEVKDILHNTRESYIAISKARDKIYSLSNKILRSDLLEYLKDVSLELEKLAVFINENNFSPEQVQKINFELKPFLDDPFKKDNLGNYIGFKFDAKTIKNILPSSGTTFVIAPEGIFVTNYHVISNAAHIYIKGIKGNYENGYEAKIIASDKNNDLAILKTEANLTKEIGKIPFIISSSTEDVGENVYTLGFPLTNTMGNEIKVTNGIISSKSGFMDDISSYQVSVPIQPGNSGGPLFDKKGYLIGVINAKHTQTENVSYAIKSVYLLNLLGLLPQKIILNKKNYLTNQSLTQQCKELSKKVFKVETTF